METWELTIVVLASVLVGALLPVLFLLTATLAAVRRRIAENATRFDVTLERFHVVSGRLESASRGLEGSEAEVARLVQVSGSLADRLAQAEKAVKVATALGNAIGPAVAAFVQGITQHHQSASPAATAAATQPVKEGGEDND
jgi:hypothetical protein